MSEQAKLVYLQERIKQIKRDERFGSLVFVIGWIFIAFYFVLPDIFPNSGVAAPATILILGILISLFGGLQISYYSIKYNSLMRELRQMSIKIQTCPKCGKQIPQGNYTFCPFCGSPLTPP